MELKLHADGQKDHLKVLKEWFYNQLNLLKARTGLSNDEKTTRLNKLKEEYRKEKEETNHNLY